MSEPGALKATQPAMNEDDYREELQREFAKLTDQFTRARFGIYASTYLVDRANGIDEELSKSEFRLKNVELFRQAFVDWFDTRYPRAKR